MSRRMLVSLMVLALAVAAIGAGTWAAFTDTESNAENSFRAGTMDLKISDGRRWPAGTPGADSDGYIWQDTPVSPIFTVQNITSANADWSHLVGAVILKNFGSVAGKVQVEIANFQSLENTAIEPELAAGDSLTDPVGELPIELMINFQPAAGGTWSAMSPLNGNRTFPATPFVLAPGASITLVSYDKWATNGQPDNLAMTDQIKFQMAFHMNQVEMP